MIKSKIFILLLAIIFCSCNSCGFFENEEVQCYLGTNEMVLNDKDEITMIVVGGNHPGEIKMLEGYAAKATLDFSKIAMNVWRPPLKKYEARQGFSFLILEPESYPHTYYFEYDLTDPNKDTFDYFVQGTTYTETKACSKRYSSGLIFPDIKDGIEVKRLKGYVTIEKFGEVNDFIIGSFEMEFEDIKDNKRILKDGKFKIIRRPDRR